MDGVLNLYKPSGPTSHDCVARLRKVLGTRRIGHAGTLDPMATGVLVIGVGSGTRVLEYLQGLPKVYRAGLVLGLETDTQDVTGRTVAEKDASGVTEAALREVLERFRGEVMQVPPMVSALKVGGKKLYELARRGETVDREPRPVSIYEIELLSFRPGVTSAMESPTPEHPGARAAAEIRVRCGAGTYVRTLCHDVGAALGVGGALSSLEREAVGPFRADQAVPLDQVDGRTPLIPLAEALEHLPRLVVDETQAGRLASGQFIPAPVDVPDGSVRVLGPDGSLRALAVARGHGEARLLAPEKVFVAADAARSGT